MGYVRFLHEGRSKRFAQKVLVDNAIEQSHLATVEGAEEARPCRGEREQRLVGGRLRPT